MEINIYSWHRASTHLRRFARLVQQCPIRPVSTKGKTWLAAARPMRTGIDTR
jgi:hypothetical protein